MSEIESLAAPLLFTGIFVDARSSVSFSSGPATCQDLKGRLKGKSFSKLLPQGLGGEHISPFTPGKKVS